MELIPAVTLAGGYLKSEEEGGRRCLKAGSLSSCRPTTRRDNLPRVVPFVLDTHPELDILIVDDNSPDGTGLLAAGLARDDPRVHALHREGKGGLGGAYIDGFKWGLERDYDLFFEMDADLSHPAGKIPAMIEFPGNTLWFSDPGMWDAA